MQKLLLSALAGLVLGLGGAALMNAEPRVELGATFLKPTLTSQLLSVQLATTSLWGTNADLNYVRIVNTGAFSAFCSFGANVTAASSSGGFVITSAASNTAASVVVVTDKNYLNKPANCAATTGTTTFSISKY